VTLLIGATFAVTSLLLHQTAAWFPGFSKMDPDTLRDFEISSGAVLLYAFAYALTALFLQRRFLSRRTPRLAGILAILLAGGWALAPNIVYFFLNRLTWKTIEQIQLGNVFNVFIVKNDDQKILHLYFAAGWVLLMVILNAPWFVSQWRTFRRFQRADEPPVISETSAAPIAPAAVEFDPK
jgi:hypothetical protein